MRPQVPAMAKMTARVCISGKFCHWRFMIGPGQHTREDAEYFLGHA